MDVIYNFFTALTSSIYRISALFVVLTLIFHVSLIYQRTLSLKNWKLIEYIWVMLAFISTLGIVDQSQASNAMSQLINHEVKLERSKDRVIDWFDNYQQLTCYEQINEAQCAVFKRIDNDLRLLRLENEKTPILEQAITQHLTQIPQLITKTELTVIAQRISEYNVQKSQYMTNVALAQRSSFQRLLSLITPLLLAFALALKMTKVTAEHLALKRKDAADNQ